MSYAINNVKVIDPGSKFHNKKVSILIKNGKIEDISNRELKGKKLIKGDQLYISKGWIDLRAHLKDPGFEQKETLEQLLHSASIGGFTNILCLPNTDPVVQNKNIIKNILSRSSEFPVDVLVSAGISKDLKGEELSELMDLSNAGAIAFTDGDRDIANTELLGHALLYTKNFDGLVMLHCEDGDISQNGQMNEGEMSTILGLKGIPHLAESSRVERNISLLEHYGGRMHISHISSPESLEMIKKAKKKGLQITCDVSINSLVMDESTVLQYDSNFKTVPPLRSKTTIKKLWKGLKDGSIDAVVSDHNAQDEESKNLEFDLAEPGILGLETLFHLLVKEAGDDFKIEAIVEKISSNPEKILGLSREGIEKGAEADLTLFSLNNSWEYDRDFDKGLAQNSPFIGEVFKTRVLATFKNKHVFTNY